MKTLLILLGIVLASAFVLIRCATKVVKICAEEEDQKIRMQIEDDRLSCGLIEED